MTLTPNTVIALLAIAAAAATLVAIIAVWFLLTPSPPNEPHKVAIEVAVSSVTLTLTVSQRGEQVATVIAETPTSLQIGPTKIN